MVLHTINKSPFNSSTFVDCLSSLEGRHVILLIEDGVYASLTGSSSVDEIAKRDDIEFYALESDIVARGILEKIAPEITLTDYSGFVKLVTECSTVQSWF